MSDSTPAVAVRATVVFGAAKIGKITKTSPKVWSKDTHLPSNFKNIEHPLNLTLLTIR